MQEFAEKRRKKSKLYSYPVIIVILIVLALLFKANISMFLKVRQSSERREQIELQLNELNKRKNDLETEISRLNTKIGVEEEMRNRFDLMKENENLIIILEEEKAELDGANLQNKETFFGKIKGWFSN